MSTVQNQSVPIDQLKVIRTHSLLTAHPDVHRFIRDYLEMRQPQHGTATLWSATRLNAAWAESRMVVSQEAYIKRNLTGRLHGYVTTAEAIARWEQLIRSTSDNVWFLLEDLGWDIS